MEARKTDFSKFLDELGCVGHGTKSQDYDWLWESEAGPFLDWLCHHITQSNLLTSDEISKWKKISVGTVMEGKNLENALENTEANLKTEENYSITDIREELNVRQAAVADMQKVKTCLNNNNGRLSISLNAFEQNLEVSRTSLADEQRKLLRLNAELNECLVKQLEALQIVQDQNSLSLDFSLLLKENDSVLASLKLLISKRLDFSPLREIEKFDALAGEIHQLRSTTVDQEQKRILMEAKREGTSIALEELKNLVKQNHHGIMTRNVPNDSLEKDIKNQQLELQSLIRDSFRQSIEQNVGRKCSGILVEDLNMKISRQKTILGEMKKVTEDLLSLASANEALGCVISQELLTFECLEKLLKESFHTHLEYQAKHQSNCDTHESMKTKTEVLARNTLPPWDTSLRSLHRLLTGKEIDPSMITSTDLLHLLQRLENHKTDLQADMSAQKRAWKNLREEVRKVLLATLQEINITEQSKYFELSSHDALSSIKNAQKDVAALETKVKEALNEWEKAGNLLQENPSLQLEKRIWKDFVIDGRKMENDVNIMRAKEPKLKL